MMNISIVDSLSVAANIGARSRTRHSPYVTAINASASSAPRPAVSEGVAYPPYNAIITPIRRTHERPDPRQQRELFPPREPFRRQ
jgi:hypothetical protein